MALDPKNIAESGVTVPALDGEAVTPHDSNELSKYSRAIYVGGAGDLDVIMASGNTVLFSAVPAGSLLPIRCSVVKATLTTATLITAIY